MQWVISIPVIVEARSAGEAIHMALTAAECVTIDDQWKPEILGWRVDPDPNQVYPAKEVPDDDRRQG